MLVSLHQAIQVGLIVFTLIFIVQKRFGLGLICKLSFVHIFFFVSLLSISEPVICSVSQENLFSFAEKVIGRSIDADDPLASRTVLHAFRLISDCDRSGWVVFTGSVAILSDCLFASACTGVEPMVVDDYQQVFGELWGTTACKTEFYAAASSVVLLFHALVAAAFCLIRSENVS